MSRELRAQTTSDRQAILALAPGWRELLSRQPRSNPFISYEWLSAWLETIGKDVTPLVITVSEDDRLVALAPMCIDRHRLLTFIGYPQSDYADILVDPQHPQSLEMVVDALWRERHRFDKAVLNQWPEVESNWQPFQSLLERKSIPHRLELADPCPAMMLHDVAEAKKTYYKRNIQSYVNWYKKQGELRHEVYEGGLDVALARLEDLFEQHIERWNGTASPSGFLEEEVCEFYRTFMRKLQPVGCAKLTALRLDETDLALYLHFDYEGTMYLYKTCYNLDYLKKSPGQVILRYLFDYALERGLEKMDFVRGDEGYKSRFANVSFQNRRIIVYRTRWARDVAGLIFAVRHSRIVDLLYRNDRVQRLRSRVLRAYYARQSRQ